MIRPELRPALTVGLMATFLAHAGCAPADLQGTLPRTASRPIEGRLAGWSSYVPYRLLGRQDRTRLSEAASRVRDRRERVSPAEFLGALASLELLAGDEKAAIAHLEEAVLLAPGDANLLSDLAATYLAQAAKGREPHNLPRALAVADRALAVDGRHAAARFNRALALESLGLLPEARRAWHSYRRLDPRSGWSGEAAARIVSLDRRLAPDPWKNAEPLLDRAAAAGDEAAVREIVKRYPQDSRAHLEERVLTRWAGLQAGGRSDEALREAEAARSIAAALAALHGDRLELDSVNAIYAARKSPDAGTRLAALARGHLRYREGLERYEPINLKGARPALVAARDDLSRGATPFAHWAELHLAICDYYESSYDESLDRLESLGEEAERRSYLALLGRVRWIEGLDYLEKSRPLDALHALRSALGIFERLGETANTASLHDRIALCLSYLGDAAESWRSLEHALHLRSEVRSPRRLYTLFYRAQDLALHQGEPIVALYFLDEAVAAARAWSSPPALAEILWTRSRVRHALGRKQEAHSDLRQAQVHAAAIQSDALKRRIEGDILWVKAQAAAAANLDSTLENLTLALQAYQEAQYPDHLIPVLLERGRAYLAKAMDDRAEEDFCAAIELYETRRRQVQDRDFRISYFDQAEAAFDTMVLFQAERRGRSSAALDYVERARARALLDSVVSVTATLAVPERPLTADAIQERLPEGVALIEYAVLNDRLLVWTVQRSRIDLRSRTMAADDLESLVVQLRLEIQRGEMATTGIAEELGRILLQPALEAAPEATVFVFVPDKSLHSVPFAALRQPGTGRLLIEDRLVEVAPSATFYVLAREHDRQLSKRVARSVLAVGNPAFDRSEYPELEQLPAAEQEARAVSQLYPVRRLLLGREATRSAFLAASHEFEVIHFAGHALANEEAPQGAKLVLAPRPSVGGSGDLFASDISRLRLPITRLVVLGACHTASGRVWSTEGVESIARPFLAAGVPTVLASLWRIEDRASAMLLQRFHAELRQGADPVAALRTAQLSLALSSDEALRRPGTWSGFELIGGTLTEVPKENSIEN